MRFDIWFGDKGTPVILIQGYFDAMPTNKNKIAFDNKKYLKIQSQEILKRINSFGEISYISESVASYLMTSRCENFAWFSARL